MKINIQKVIKCVSCLVTCFMLVVAGMATPANALTYLNPDDYLYEITSDGTNKIARYDFSSLYCYIHTWDDSSTVHADYRWEVYYQVPDDAWTVLMDLFPLGGYQEATSLDWRSVALDIHDILPGSPLPFECAFTYDYLCNDGYVGGTLYYSVGVYYFDKNGDYVGTVDGVVHTLDIGLRGGESISDRLVVSGSFPAKAYYAVPFLVLRTVFDTNDHQCTIAVRGDFFNMEVSIDAVIENSNMMQSINNKLDNILTGTPGQNESANNSAGTVEDQKDQIEDLVDQMTPEKPNLDHIDTDINAIAGDEATDLFADGMSGILNHPLILSMLSIVAVVSFIGYVLFGKGG